MPDAGRGRVHVRTPTYRRPELLARCLASLQAQTWRDWICDVYDDDPERSGEGVCAAVQDPRIRYVHNRPQRFASANIDQCFSRRNPHGADYFCVVEDDNYLLPGFMEENVRRILDSGVQLILRNQRVEFSTGGAEASLGGGVLDGQFVERTYSPDLFRLALMAGIGVSNGGLFWSREARTDLEIGVPCTATAQEYMRTFLIRETILVAMEPLAVWAENGAQTTRDLGDGATYYRREFDLKRRVQALQRRAWRLAPRAMRSEYLTTDAFSSEPVVRARGLTKALLATPALAGRLPLRERVNLTARGLLIRGAGRLDGPFRRFLAERTASFS